MRNITTIRLCCLAVACLLWAGTSALAQSERFQDRGGRWGAGRGSDGEGRSDRRMSFDRGRGSERGRFGSGGGSGRFGGFEGRSGDEGRPGFGGRFGGDRDESRRGSADRGESNRFGGGRSSDTRPGPARGTPPTTTAQKPRTPVRVTVDLPSQFDSLDTDRDGQIGLYEWPRTQHALFAEIDRNGDGFLTPRELKLSNAVPPAVVATATGAANPQSRLVSDSSAPGDDPLDWVEQMTRE